MAPKPGKDDKKGKKPEKTTDIDPDDFMSKTELKTILALAENGQSVPCAIGMTSDKRHGVVMLAKRGRGKTVMGDMQDTAEELNADLDSNIRYGRASYDPKTGLTFRVHKEAPGAMWSPIQRRMKLAGYGQINITTDPSLENESDDNAAKPTSAAPAGAAADAPAATGTPAPGSTASAMPAAGAPAADSSAAGTAAPGTAAPGAGAPATPAAGAPAADTPAPAAAAAANPEQEARLKELTNTLATLLKQVAAAVAANPALKENILPIAAAARTALHDGKADIAADLIETLDDELKAAVTDADASGGAAAPNVKSIADKAQMAWGAYLKIAAREVGKLRAEVTSAYRDHGFGSEVDNFFRKQIDPAIERLQEGDLVAKLAAVSKSADAAEQRQLLAEGVKIVETLEGLVASDPVLKKLDENPFTDLVIAKTAAATLGTLKKTLRTAAQG